MLQDKRHGHTCNGSEHAGLATARGSHNEQRVASLKGHAEVATQLQGLGGREHVEGPQRQACLPPLSAHNLGRPRLTLCQGYRQQSICVNLMRCLAEVFA